MVRCSVRGNRVAGTDGPHPHRCRLYYCAAVQEGIHCSCGRRRRRRRDRGSSPVRSRANFPRRLSLYVAPGVQAALRLPDRVGNEGTPRCSCWLPGAAAGAALAGSPDCPPRHQTRGGVGMEQERRRLVGSHRHHRCSVCSVGRWLRWCRSCSGVTACWRGPTRWSFVWRAPSLGSPLRWWCSS